MDESTVSDIFSHGSVSRSQMEHHEVGKQIETSTDGGAAELLCSARMDTDPS